MTDQYRQGNGETRIFHGEAPTAREDGTPLDPSEIDHYKRLATYNGGAVEEMDVQLVDGAFSEQLDIDSIAVGTYEYWYQTVDTGGRVSADSDHLTFEVLAPLANPLPPVVS